MFGVILISAISLMHIYVFWRAASVPFLKRRVSRKFLIGTALVLWAGFFFARVYGHAGTGVLNRILELLGMSWMGILFLCFVSLLAMDLITGFGLLLPHITPSLRGLGLFAGGVLSVIAFVQGLRPPVVQDYEVYLSNLPIEMDGTVLVAVSDLHLGSLLAEHWLEARVAQVRAQRPNLIVLLGDIFEGHGQPKAGLLAAIARLSAPLGVWAVLGNHEFHGDRNANISLMEKTGVQVLHNRWAEIAPGLVLAGVEDLTARRRSGRDDDPISKSLAHRPPGATILLSHTPWQTEVAAAAGVDLMLCGHTHGGQIWPFGYLVRLSYPLLEGSYQVGAMTVIVCRGTGTWGPRMRLWRPAELLRVTLRHK